MRVLSPATHSQAHATAHAESKGNNAFGKLLREMTSPRRIAIGLTVYFAPSIINSIFKGNQASTHSHSAEQAGSFNWSDSAQDWATYFFRLVAMMLTAIFLDTIVPKFHLHKPGKLHIHQAHSESQENEHQKEDLSRGHWLQIKATDQMRKGGLGEALKDTFNKTNLSLAFSIASVNTLIQAIQDLISKQVDSANQAWVSLFGVLAKVLGTFVTARFVIGREEFNSAGDMLKNWEKLITGFVCPCHGTMICMSEIEAIIQSVAQLFRNSTGKQSTNKHQVDERAV